jgi:hypothetical protein
MLRWTDGGHFWTAQRRSPHPPLRPVRQQQSRRDHPTSARAFRLGHVSGRAIGRDRSAGASARPPMPLLRRSHAHHRDLRGRLPTTSQADRTSRPNQDRHVMSASTSSRAQTVERFPRWSSTGYPGARPHARPAPLSAPRSAATPIVMGAESNPTSHTNSRNQPADTPRSLVPASSLRSNPHR